MDKKSEILAMADKLYAKITPTTQFIEWENLEKEVFLCIGDENDYDDLNKYCTSFGFLNGKRYFVPQPFLRSWQSMHAFLPNGCDFMIESHDCSLVRIYSEDGKFDEKVFLPEGGDKFSQRKLIPAAFVTACLRILAYIWTPKKPKLESKKPKLVPKKRKLVPKKRKNDKKSSKKPKLGVKRKK